MPFDPHVNRFHELVARLFGARGHASGQTVLDDVMPVVNINEEAADQLWLRGERLITTYGDCAAGGAGQYGSITFGFETDRKQLYWVQKLHITKPTTGTISAYLDAGIITPYANASHHPRDARMGLGAGVAAARGPDGIVVGSGIDAVAPINQLGIWIACTANTHTVFELDWIITYGTRLRLKNHTANETFYAHASGIVRDADEQELR